MLGKMCLVVMYPVPAPDAFAASMKGLSRRLRTWERMTLAKPIQPKNPRTNIMFCSDGPRTATSTIISGRPGITSIMSVNLIKTSSTARPR